jgi:hypothetical protein
VSSIEKEHAMMMMMMMVMMMIATGAVTNKVKEFSMDY